MSAQEKAMRINPDLQKERDAATFNSEKLTFLLEGSQDVTERRRRVGTYLVLARELL